ncbi:MAG: hypothetical protein KTR31_18755 [Myxococcales bacterium]|nr:hypothetical protein [Myxococcales bacterium]
MLAVPRNAALDAALAAADSTSEALLVYADWLTEREHPLAEWIRDGELAARGEPDAAQRVLERHYDAVDLRQRNRVVVAWRGIAVGLEVDPVALWDGGEADQELKRVLAMPWCALLTSMRVALCRQEEVDAALLALLSELPASVGRLQVCDPSVRATSGGGAYADLSAVRCPNLVDVRLRVEGIAAAPAADLSGVRRLELCAGEATALLDGRDWPRLRTLHAWTSVGREELEGLVRGAPRLRTLGLHHGGALDEIAEWPLLTGQLLAGIEELVLQVASADAASLGGLARRLPPTVRTVRVVEPGMREGGGLPDRFSRELPDDVPLIW